MVFVNMILLCFQIRTLKGHTNEKNFVGLSVNSDYIACGSETNEVCVYHKVYEMMSIILSYLSLCLRSQKLEPLHGHCRFGSNLLLGWTNMTFFFCFRQFQNQQHGIGSVLQSLMIVMMTLPTS